MKVIKQIDVVANGDELLKRLELVRANKGLQAILERHEKSRELRELISSNINSRHFMLDGNLMSVSYCNYKDGNYPNRAEPVKLSELCLTISDLIEIGIPLCMNDECISGDYDFSWRMPYRGSFYYRDDSELKETYVITSNFIDYLLDNEKVADYESK